MQKRLVLVGITLLVGVGAYLVFSSGDRRSRRVAPVETPRAVRDFITPVSSQPAKSFSDSEMTFSPGEETRVRVYDEVSGRLKYQFEAKSWEPTSTTDFDLKDVLVQIYTPRGEVTTVSADEANMTLARKGKNRVEPRSGRLTKNVKVVIDRTTTAWREAHPDEADPAKHPDDLVHISLEDARFDLEQAELQSDGAVRVDSLEGQVENMRGLLLQWNQVDGRIDTLKFAHGGKMTLRRGGKLIDFGMPGGEREARRDRRSGDASVPPIAAPRPAANAGTVPMERAQIAKAQANMPISIDAMSADDAAEQIRSEGGAPMANMPRAITVESKSGATPSGPVGELRSPQALATAMESLQQEARAAGSGELAEMLAREQNDKKSRRRIHTYRAVFSNQVVVEQTDGTTTFGKLEADKLELNFDFGKQQKEMASADKGKPSATQPATTKPQPAKPDAVDGEDKTRLVLTWDGPLEMHPLRVNPEEQSGQRFDAVATGKIVKLSNERGGGSCKQLVYRHERRQVWLSGSAADPVRLSPEGAQKLVAREIFFDQKRGLAHIEGAGSIEGVRQEGGDELLAVAANPKKSSSKTRALTASPDKPRKPQEPVRIVWSRGVNIEMGARPVERMNPNTGAMETKQKEYLRRAWFHGDVDMRQGGERLSGDEVAITFAQPSRPDQIAEHVQFLNMTGRVRLEREQDLITADKLDAEMTVFPDGKSGPKAVDASGDVIARQADRIIRAERMKVGMGQVVVKGPTVVRGDKIEQTTRTRSGIETLDAEGSVHVHDPSANLKIRDAKILRARIEDGNRLVQATIDGVDAAHPAKVRAGDTAIHGKHIEIDVPTESIDVPGPGAAWMLSQQDFGARRMTRPSRVKIAWSGQMLMRGEKSYGVFVGDVRSKSDAFSMACDKLTVRLADAPPAAKKPSQNWMDSFWLARISRATHAKTDRAVGLAQVAPRKRPAFVVAEGHAEALSSEYAKATQAGPGRLVSRMQIVGPQIVADLAHERMSVPGKGTLLIEDYSFDDSGKRSRSSAGPRSGPLMSSAQGEGPSQTLVKWAASMDYYVDQNWIAFDKDVEMRHFSGRKMVMKEELVAGMGLDPNLGRNLKDGRRAELTAGYLLLEFKTAPRKDDKASGGQPPVRATDLERLIAKHEVHLQEDTKSLMGEYVQYLAATNEVQVEGKGTVEARIMDQDERDQRMNMWRGPILIWNRRTNAIEAPQSTIRTTRR